MDFKITICTITTFQNYCMYRKTVLVVGTFALVLSLMKLICSHSKTRMLEQKIAKSVLIKSDCCKAASVFVVSVFSQYSAQQNRPIVADQLQFAHNFSLVFENSDKTENVQAYLKLSSSGLNLGCLESGCDSICSSPSQKSSAGVVIF